MKEDNFLIESRRVFLDTEMTKLKKHYKILRDLAVKASPDDEGYINYLEEEFNRNIKKTVNEISIMM